MNSKRELSALFIYFVLAIGPGWSASIARIWNEQLLSAIRLDFPNPPVHARNLFHTSVAMWDAWACYDTNAVGYLHRELATAADIAAARREAISYAAYRVLHHRYSLSVASNVTHLALTNQMIALNYDPVVTTTNGNTPAAVGNRVAATVLAFAATDGSNETINYTDATYAPVNIPLILAQPGTTMYQPNRWQPLAFEFAVTQNGLIASKVQVYVGSHWGPVRPFAMELTPGNAVYLDPGPPPHLGTITDAAFKDGNVTVIRRSSNLDPASGEMIDISPASRGNNPLGTMDGQGYPTNPVTGQSYPPHVVPHGDYGRVVAEFWADGPHSETPPGHWNVLANYVADQPGFTRQLGGIGPSLDELAWDVKIYFALNAAVHDAAVAAWGAKRKYDYVRPISSIRYMAGRGQSSDPGGAAYHPNGLPLVPGLIELVTAQTAATGQRHEGLTPGKMAIFAWGGEPTQPANQFTGSKWIHAESWLPYQRNTFVTPAFAGYTSGHSTFSRAAAEVLTRATGSAYFPGGLGTFTATNNAYLQFELGPSVNVVLQWATYYDAADEAGISRLYGGIHVPADDFKGRISGSQCGIKVWDLAIKYFDGSVLGNAPSVSLTTTNGPGYQLHWKGRRGLYYNVQTSTNLSRFDPTGTTLWCEEPDFMFSYPTNTPQALFFRIRQSPTNSP